MKKRTFLKRALSILMVAVMTVGIAPLSGFVGFKLPSFADLFSVKAEAFSENGYHYFIFSGNAGNDNAGIFGCDDSIVNGDITIPSTLGGYPVVSIGDYAFDKCTSLTSVTFGENSQLTSIGRGAFENCTSLTSVIFGENSQLKDIGYDAFRNCNSLASITIPDSTTSIGGGAFENCTSLTSIIIPDGVTNVESLFCGCTSLTNITIPDSVNSIESSAFKGCKDLTSVTFGENSQLTSIGYSAFDSCTSLTNITIPDSVTSIGDYAFNGCTSLTSVTVPNSVTSIGEYAFYGCTSLTSITIPDSVTSIGEYAFYGCTSLTNITIPDGVTSIGEWVFSECTSLASITIPGSVTTIGDFAFYECNNLVDVYCNGDVADWCGITFVNDYSNPMFYATNLYINGEILTNAVIPDNITKLNYTFRNCKNLTSVTIPDSVTSIGNDTFENCTSLTNVTFGENSQLTSIGNYAFYDCTSLTSITIPDSVTSIGTGAFCWCESLASVTFGENSQLTSIGEDAFYECRRITSITIPNSVTTIGDEAFAYCLSLKRVTFEENSQLTSIGKDAFFGCYSYVNVYYNDDIADWCGIKFESDSSNPMSFGQNLYINGELLTNAVIPDNITELNYTFINCKSLTSVTIPDSVTSIGNSAFDNCKSLTTITIPDGVTSIGDYAFSGCRSLASVTIPDGVTSIGDRAFNWCEILISVKIPDSVTSIGTEAFNGCTRLSNVYYVGSEEDWNKIEIKDYNTALTGANIHFNYTEDICNHIPVEYKVPATCTADGETKLVCSECNEVIYVKPIPALGHNFSKWTVSVAPTNETDGKEERVCSVCFVKEERKLEKLGETYTDTNTGVSVVVPNTAYDKKIEIDVEKQADNSHFEILSKIENFERSVIYDITTFIDGEPTQPKEKVTVKLPLPEGYNPENSFVYYINELKGEITDMKARYENGYMIFETDHFSLYSIVEVKAPELVSIEIVTPPTTTSYTYKKDASLDGLKVKAVYSNGKEVDVTENVNITNFDTTATGDKVAVVEFEGKTATFDYSVSYAWWQWIIIIVLFGWIWY